MPFLRACLGLAFGLGAGMAGTTGTSASLHLIGDERMGSANAAHQTLRRLAQGMGPAVALTVLGSRDADGIESFRRVWWAVLTAYVISAAIGALYPRHHEP